LLKYTSLDKTHTEEELRALMSYHEVEGSYLNRIRKCIGTRTGIIIC